MGPEKYFQGHRLEILCLVLFQALEGHFPLLIFQISAFGCLNSPAWKFPALLNCFKSVNLEIPALGCCMYCTSTSLEVSGFLLQFIPAINKSALSLVHSLQVQPTG
jgi:hypothetical protein